MAELPGRALTPELGEQSRAESRRPPMGGVIQAAGHRL